GTGALYWCLQDSSNVPKSVTELITRTRANGRIAYLVATQGFDDLMVRLALRCLDAPPQAKAIELIAKNSGGSDAPRSPFRIDATDPTTILKSNAFEIEC